MTRSRQRAAIAAAIAVAVIGGWLAWRGSGHPLLQSGLCRGCNVLLITIDTLRSDRVGAFGGPAGLTPALDRLAAEGVRLTRAYSPAPLTLPSHASMLTAVSPPAHGVRTNGLFRLGPERPTLATVLKGAGYRTAAFVGAFVLDARFGLNRGFDVYDDRYGEKHEGDSSEGAERRAEDVIKPATAWILHSEPGAPTPEPQTRPWFAWIHLYDPHEPYRAPEPYASQRSPYDAEVAYTDAMVGKLMDDLRAAAQLDQTVIVAAADHGESLGEHGERTHGVFTYDVTMRVPWILWAGRRVVPGASDALVRLIDVAPTILDLLGIAAPAGFEGRTAIPAIAGVERGSRNAYIEAMDANLTRNWAPLTGIVSGGYKLIELPIPELFDLTADPGETANQFGRDARRARDLSAALHDILSAIESGGAAAPRTTLSADAQRRLRALGYVATAARPGGRAYTDADDPKRLIAVAEELNRALHAFYAGSRPEAIAAVRAVIREHPTFTTAYGELAAMQHDTGDLAGAIATLEEIVGRGTVDQSVLVVLGGYLQEAGGLGKSVEILEAVASSYPDYADAHNSLGVAYSRLGRHAEARAAFRRVLDLDPTSARAYENLGVDELAAGNLEPAAADLARALTLDPDLAGAHNALAAVLLRQGRHEEALQHWRTALQLNPRSYDALYNAATVLLSLGRREEARPYLQRFVNEAPPFRYAQDIARFRRALGQ